MTSLTLNDIRIRTDLRPGDLGLVTHLHGKLYHDEYQYGIKFESYVAAGLAEFYNQYRPETNRAWVCECENKMVGFLALMDRGKAAQLRYFLITPNCRGLGLGKKLMDLYMEFLKAGPFESSYLWTTHELTSAASLYVRHGYKLVEQKESAGFGKPVREQKYELLLDKS